MFRPEDFDDGSKDDCTRADGYNSRVDENIC